MKKYGQIFLGGSRVIANYEELAKKIEFLGKQPDFCGFLCGWPVQKSAYFDVIRRAGEFGKEFYLWLPVFAEFEAYKPFKPLQNILDEKINWNSYSDSESFVFCCPASAADYWIQLFEENFSDLPCSGIMLDRVRFPSPVIGWQALFTCTCDQCCAYYRTLGISKKDIAELCMEIKSNIGQTSDVNPLGITEYKDGRYCFENRLLQKYFDARLHLIAGEVQKIVKYLKSRGYRVGLDLFSPFMAYFLGQDYETVSAGVDFIKVMLYRYTNTPAGIRYEIDNMARALCKNAGDPDEFNRKRFFWEELLNADREDDFSGFTRREYASARKHTNSYIYVGMETNVCEGLCDITPSMIRRSKMEAGTYNADGVVASWDIATSPYANLKEFAAEN